MGNVTGVFAQQRPSEEERRARFEKFKTEREEFISKAMKLTNDEKKVFWPLCNELQVKKFELNKTLRDETRKINRAHREKQPVAEADYKNVLELGSRVKVQEAQLEQEYLSKFLQVIPAEKVFLYRQSEQNFGERMVRERTDRNAQRLSDNVQRQITREKMQAAKVKTRAELAKKRAELSQKRVELAKERVEKARIRAEKLKAQAEKERQQHQRGSI
jgi:hypothetical protein